MGPELLKEEQGQNQVQAGGEQEEKGSVLPAGPETKDTLDWFTLEPEAAWLLGTSPGFRNHRVPRIQVLYWRPRGTRRSSDLGPIVSASLLTCEIMRFGSRSDKPFNCGVSMSVHDI